MKIKFNCQVKDLNNTKIVIRKKLPCNSIHIHSVNSIVCFHFHQFFTFSQTPNNVTHFSHMFIFFFFPRFFVVIFVAVIRIVCFVLFKIVWVRFLFISHSTVEMAFIMFSFSLSHFQFTLESIEIKHKRQDHKFISNWLRTNLCVQCY